ncbi:uncharacterized protein PFL1_03734 [Pseudozyma flocculosa PF-1]|uniref:Ribosomal L1 domain-containing protein 1 n=2 Tax=Pseudozyma flocculosa TaxID=84751 RepID=A0A5C3F4G1_9BASI|nr:uncharacterized protein PFL1_03734 [Pseudozyma flocculosa PF-1]EPQ28934.1 hypothetical protein PFL1_03734 [Pseudozyma flocculosa PF-1]SPO38577.1 related to UTP30 - subunit of U3-containing 90S pre-ribosome [Pseudozyma flocculosa]
MPAVTKKVVAVPTKGQQEYAAGKVDPAQALKAFKALAAHADKLAKQREDDANAKNVLPLDGPQGDLRDRNNTVFLQVAVKQLNPEAKVKPVRVPVPNAVHRPGQVSVCLLVKDPQREYKDLLTKEKITSVARVVGVTKLKGKFKPFEARRDLVKDHDLFLVDQRIVPLVPKICGKVFFDAKKNPITVDVVRTRHLKEELESAISSTYFLQNKGSTSSIKLGYLSSHTPEQLQENLVAAVPAVISKIPGGWNNIQNIEVKTGSSASLPIWNCSLGMKRVVPAAAEGEEDKKKKKKDQQPAPAADKKAKGKAVEEAVSSPASAKGKKAAAAETSSPAATSKKRKAEAATEAAAETPKSKAKGKAAAAASPKTSSKQIQEEAALEDAALELSPSDDNDDEDEEEQDEAAAAGDVSVSKKKPSPRKTRSATAAAATRKVGKDKVETPTKKASASASASAGTGSGSGKKTTSSTTRGATGKGKAKK